ncbi:H-NS histone family protein [Klebsiella pneumoniae]|uniref:H-NS histone family protein n=1 Tax=Klebsiella pneumoniae TaxID=573 RepID=A0A927DKT1_KLEPN|nr:H-NS histone family protein [Klebsiella pneumoniae]
MADIQPPKAGRQKASTAPGEISLYRSYWRRENWTGQGRMPKPIAEAVARG